MAVLKKKKMEVSRRRLDVLALHFLHRLSHGFRLMLVFEGSSFVMMGRFHCTYFTTDLQHEEAKTVYYTDFVQHFTV